MLKSKSKLVKPNMCFVGQKSNNHICLNIITVSSMNCLLDDEWCCIENSIPLRQGYEP